MNLYTISDTHFGHTKLQDADIRPKDNDVKLWKGFDAIPHDSILIHCGDFTIGADATAHAKLREYKFKKWLLIGNHDNHSISWYITNGWDFVAHEVVIKMFGQNILFSHYPLPRREGISRNIHGHLHGGKSRGVPPFYEDGYHIEVTPEVIGYSPAKVGTQVI